MKRRASKSLVRIAPWPWLSGHVGSFVFIVIAVFSLIFSSVNPQSAGDVRSGLSEVLVPVVHVATVPVQRAALFVRDVTGLTQLQAQNVALSQENMKLKGWYHKAQSLEAENQNLRALLNLKLEPHHRYVTARVFADTGRRFVQSVQVDAGARDGVQKGQAAVSAEGLIGRVIETSEHSARVLLVTDINARVPVMIEGDMQHAVMSGDNDGLPVLRHLPDDYAAQKGQRVVTSGYGGVFPAGLPVGRVAMDEKDGKARVELFADLNALMHVRIVDSSVDPNLRVSQ